MPTTRRRFATGALAAALVAAAGPPARALARPEVTVHKSPT
jgi:hypothetical protein